MSKGSAGALLSLSLIVGIPFGFVVGWLAGRAARPAPDRARRRPDRDRRLGRRAADPMLAPWLWAVLMGVGFGTGFTLVLALFVLRAPDAPHAAALSGMAQSVGYTLGGDRTDRCRRAA